MNLTYFQPRKRRNEENKNNSSLNIRLVVKTSENYLEISDSRKLSRNIRSDIKTSEVATLLTNNNNSEISQRSEISLDTGGSRLCSVSSQQTSEDRFGGDFNPKGKKLPR